MFFITEFEKAAKSHEDCRSLFLNTFSSSRVNKGLKKSSITTKVAEKAVEINQDQ